MSASGKVKGLVTKYGAYLPPDVLNSAAFAELSAVQIRSYCAFLRRVRKVPSKTRWHRGQKVIYLPVNEREIILPYSSGAAELHVTEAWFGRCVDALVHYGFLDTVPPGDQEAQAIASNVNPPTIYAISKRYLQWGTPSFVSQDREKDKRRVGFQDPRRGVRRALEAKNKRMPYTAGKDIERSTSVLQESEERAESGATAVSLNKDKASPEQKAKNVCNTGALQMGGPDRATPQCGSIAEAQYARTVANEQVDDAYGT
jgi:hypothetical protein